LNIGVVNIGSGGFVIFVILIFVSKRNVSVARLVKVAAVRRAHSVPQPDTARDPENKHRSFILSLLVLDD